MTRIDEHSNGWPVRRGLVRGRAARSRAGTPLAEAERASTGASADPAAPGIGAAAGPVRGPVGTLGHPPNDRACAARTPPAGGADSAAERSGRERDGEAHRLAVRLGTGRGESLEGHGSRPGCYGQFILEIGLEIGL